LSNAVNESIICSRGLSFSYNPESQQPIPTLKGIDLEVHPGEYPVIIGHDGSGKSTLAKHFNALLHPTWGEVRVKGFDTCDRANTLAVRRAGAMIFQISDNQIVATVVEEDVAFGPENLGLPRCRRWPEKTGYGPARAPRAGALGQGGGWPRF